MNIESCVINTFNKLNLTPRDGQLEVCSKILSSFLIDNKSTVVVDAPTGSGKSVIAMVVSLALEEIISSKKTSVIVTATNVLAKQYEKDFDFLSELGPMYGAVQYKCGIREELKSSNPTAEQCYRKSKYFYSSNTSKDVVLPSSLEDKHCTTCEFAKSRSYKNDKSIIITNYSYFILDRIFLSPKNVDDQIPTFDKRPLFVFDEAHLINEQFVDHMAIHYSSNRALEYLADINSIAASDGYSLAYTNLFNLINENIARSTIGHKNIDKFLTSLMKFYYKMSQLFESRATFSRDESSYDRLKSLHRKYHGLFCKIDDYFKYKYESAITINSNTLELTVKPIFVGNCWSQLSSSYNLFLSATIDPDFLYNTLGLSSDDMEYIRLDYPFEQDDKTIIIPPKNTLPKLNYQSVNDLDTLQSLSANINSLLQLHTNESGIILTPSFSLAEEIYNRLIHTHNFILHRKGQKLEEVLNEFLNRSANSVLISPSLFEGINLAGEISSFQVMLKAPYYSLADKRMSIIMRKHRKTYLQMTLMRLIQGLGRSTRFKGDKSVTYFMDANLIKLFNSKYNSWADQFEIIKDFALV